MKIKQLRLLSGCYALKATDNVMQNKTTWIERLATGDFLVHEGERDVLIPRHRVDFAVCEDEPDKVPVAKK